MPHAKIAKNKEREEPRLLEGHSGILRAPLTPSTEFSSRAFLNIRVPMRDGTKLATHVYLPPVGGPFPVVLTRTPYDGLNAGAKLDWPERGYARVLQDVRGRFLSEGEWYPWFHEQADAEDTLDWIAAQSWCNGRVAMYGGSYPGWTQVTAALTGHQALKCITPCLIGAEAYHTCYSGGAFRLSWQTSWTIEPKIVSDQNVIQRHLPLREIDLYSRGTEVPFWRDALNHPARNDFWNKCSWTSHLKRLNAPAFIRTGWFDLFVNDVFDLFNGLRNHGAPELNREASRILVGPWPHNINQRIVGEEDFGEFAVLADLADEEIAYIERFIGPGGDTSNEVAPVRLFIMGANEWRDECEWPIARAVSTEWFLGSKSPANSSAGCGTLGSHSAGRADTYSYDPADPVPTLGGAWEFTNVGPRDQSTIEKRPDVLVYTSDELAEDLEVIGVPVLRLFASSSAPDTDFTAKLVDLRSDGRAMSVTDGIIRARYRNGTGEPEFLDASQIYEFTIKCNPTAYLFKKGHRVRLEVSSSNFPAFSRNLNMRDDIADGVEMCIAHQTVRHSADYPSRLILPVIPKV